MAIITFLKEEEKPIGKTMSTLAIATYMAMEHNVRTLVVSTDYNQKAVQRCFWEEEKPKKVNFGIFGPNTKTLDSENGMKGLEKIIKSIKITPNLITDYTKVVFKERLEVLLGTENDDQEDLAKAYPEVIAAANQYYDRVLIDLDDYVPESARETILNMSDVIVLTLPQGLSKIEAFRQEKEKKENPLLESPKTVLLIGKYDRASKYNSKNITRYLKEKNQVLTIPYNTLYFESSEEGTVADLFLKLRKYADTNKDDENSFFMREIKRATDNIVYRLVK